MKSPGDIKLRRSAMIAIWLFVATCELVFFQNCAPANHNTSHNGLIETDSSSVDATFPEIFAKIIEPKCLGCHAAGPYNFSSYSSLLASGVVTAGQPLASSLYLSVESGSMPDGGPPLSSTSIEALYQWILAGAPGDGSPAPSPTPTPSPMPTPQPAPTVGTFTWFNQAVIQPKCIACHSGNAPKGGYDLSAYAQVLTRVTPGNALGSILYQELQSGSMPKGMAKLSATDLNGVKAWINGGALNN